MTNYALPVNDKDISKAKTFYDLICWGGLLIVLLPVGIANVILGYFMGDSPCTLCWGQRQEMAYIGVVALFMVRYGFKPKYLATMLVMAAVGLYMSFRHYGNHAMRDVGQGSGASSSSSVSPSTSPRASTPSWPNSRARPSVR